MDPILKKMTWKPGMNVRVWNTPPEFEKLVQSWQDSGLIKPDKDPDLMLAFVQTPTEVQQYFDKMRKLASADQQLWMAYPKGSSKRYKAQINRDAGWAHLGQFDYEGVRQIAINEDWSALRFRKLEFIKTMTRKFTLKDQKNK